MMEQIVKNAMLEAEKNSRINDGDYIKDGLYYCGKCHTQKQSRINIFGQIKTPMCDCKCEAERKEKERELEERIEFDKEMSRYRYLGFDPSELQKKTFENADGSHQKEMEAVKRYVDNYDEYRKQGKGLLLLGDVGTGKTYAAACVVNELLAKRIKALMTNFKRITNNSYGKFENRQEFFDSLNKFSLLVIDDLATERNTDYMQEIIFDIIDNRYLLNMPLIITTNLTWEELVSTNDTAKQRIYSRIIEMCIPIKFDGEDKRKKKIQETLKDTRKSLGL